MRVTPAAYKLELSIMGQKMCFGIICINFATPMGNITVSIIFAKIREIPYFHNVKNSIGNNSGSVDEI